MRCGLALWLLAAVGSVACAPTSYLMAQETVGGRSVSYILKQAGVSTDSEGNKELVYSFHVRICDHAEGAAPVCKDSLVLDNVAEMDR